jgi:hypothetical protein
VDFKMRIVPRFRGRVVDGQTGQPITVFQIDTYRIYRGDYIHIDRMSIQDVKGEFALKSTSGESSFVACSAQGYNSVLANLDHQDRVQTVELDKNAESVMGQVLWAGSREPAVGAEVKLPGQSTLTDAQGKFQIDIPKGMGSALSLEVLPKERPGYRKTFTVSTEDDNRDVGVLLLGNEGRIEGWVRGPGGVPLPGQEVAVTFHLMGIVESAVTDSEGYYHVDQLPAGHYLVLLSQDNQAMDAGFSRWGKGHELFVREVRLETEQTQEVSFRLDEGCSVSGEVVFLDQDLAFVEGHVVLYDQNMVVAMSEIDSKHRFVLQGFPAGDYHYEVHFVEQGIASFDDYDRMVTHQGDVSIPDAAEFEWLIEIPAREN